MFKKINRIKAFLKVAFHLSGAQESLNILEPVFTSRLWSDSDIVCLSMGRWLYFKHLHLPQYTIGLDKDHESLLDQYTFKVLGGASKKLIEYTLDQTRLKVEICAECVDRALTVRQYLIEKEFIKK